MEDQAEYKTKERPFHGDYTSSGQGKKEGDYSFRMMVQCYIYAAFFGIVFFTGIYTLGLWLWNEFIKHWVSALFILALTVSCSPGEMVGTGYLATVEEGIMVKWDRVETAEQADRFVFKKTGLVVKTDSLIGDVLPYWDLEHGRQYIYVEKKGIYQRKPRGKKRWRVYDEQLESSEFNVQSLK
jgi:hypothetical protein